MREGSFTPFPCPTNGTEWDGVLKSHLTDPAKPGSSSGSLLWGGGFAEKKMYLLPLLSTLFSGLFSGSMFARYYGHRGSGVINVLCLFIAFVSSLCM